MSFTINQNPYSDDSPPVFNPEDPEENLPAEVPPLRPQSLTLLLDTTNQCNLRCRMCHFSREEIARKGSQPMSRGAFQRIAREVFPLAHTLLLSAAAEPLIHPDFPEFLQIASSFHPRHLKFLTNAQLLTPEISSQCIRCGVSEIHVSVDGATPETYEWVRRNADFRRLVANLSHLQRLKKESGSRLPILQFNIVLMRRNITELGELTRLAVRLGVERISCRHLVLFDGLGLQDESLFSHQDWANEQMAGQLQEMAGKGVDLVQFPDFFSGSSYLRGPEERRFETHRPERSLWNRIPHRLRWGLRSALQSLRCRKETRYPIGAVETPLPGKIPAIEGIRFSGWALHHSGVERIVFGRKPLPGENPQTTDALGLIEIGEAERKNSLRPDLQSSFPSFPESYRAEWFFHLSKSSLPSATRELTLFITAWGKDGSHSILGKRIVYPNGKELVFGEPFCCRPFDSVYIDSSSNVYPYPDCLECPSFGTLESGKSFPEIWGGKDYRKLRRGILRDDPPVMCRICPDFINRRVNDPSLFTARTMRG